MMIFMLKNHAPDEYRDRFEVTGKDGGALSLELLLKSLDEPKTIEHQPPETLSLDRKAEARHRTRWRQAASYPSRSVSQNCTRFSEATADFRIPVPLGAGFPRTSPSSGGLAERVAVRVCDGRSDLQQAWLASRACWGWVSTRPVLIWGT